jgi:hypothetical protein
MHYHTVELYPNTLSSFSGIGLAAPLAKFYWPRGQIQNYSKQTARGSVVQLGIVRGFRRTNGNCDGESTATSSQLR